MNEEEYIQKLLDLGWKWGYVFGHGNDEPAGGFIDGEQYVIADVEKSSVLIPPKYLFGKPIKYEDYF